MSGIESWYLFDAGREANCCPVERYRIVTCLNPDRSNPLKGVRIDAKPPLLSSEIVPLRTALFSVCSNSALDRPPITPSSTTNQSHSPQSLSPKLYSRVGLAWVVVVMNSRLVNIRNLFIDY